MKGLKIVIVIIIYYVQNVRLLTLFLYSSLPYIQIQDEIHTGLKSAYVGSRDLCNLVCFASGWTRQVVSYQEDKGRNGSERSP